MENPENSEPPMAESRGNDDGNTAVSPSIEPSAQPNVGVAETGTTGALVVPEGTGIVGGNGEEDKEEEEAAVGGGDGSGLGKGDGGDEGGDREVDGSDMVGGSGLESRGEVPVEVMEEEIAERAVVEETLVISESSSDPKGKGIAMEEPVITPASVGLTASDYAVFARQEDVMERAQENPTVLDAVLEEVRVAREAEMARVWAAVEEERDAEAWARDFEEEVEGEDEVEAWIQEVEEEEAATEALALAEMERS